MLTLLSAKTAVQAWAEKGRKERLPYPRLQGKRFDKVGRNARDGGIGAAVWLRPPPDCLACHTVAPLDSIPPAAHLEDVNQTRDVALLEQRSGQLLALERRR